MLKPDSLRRALTDAVTVLKTSPEMLRIFVDNGSIASTLATSLSFEKRYTLNVIVTDFTGDFDLLIVPVLAWRVGCAVRGFLSHHPTLLTLPQTFRQFGTQSSTP